MAAGAEGSPKYESGCGDGFGRGTHRRAGAAVRVRFRSGSVLAWFWLKSARSGSDLAQSWLGFGSDQLRSGSVPDRFRIGLADVAGQAHAKRVLACAWRALACAWHALARARCGGGRRSFHRRVAAPMRPFFTPFFRSGDEDLDGGIHCSIRCPEE